jgi:hypothetical protein
MQAFEAARGAGDGANGDANGGSGIQRTSDVAQAIGEAILQHDPVDRKRLARELASHKLLHLAQILDPDLKAAKSTPQVYRGSFGLPILTSADAKKLPGVNLGNWADPRVDLARQSPQHPSSVSTGPAGSGFRLSRSQLRLVASIIEREATNERLEAGVLAGRRDPRGRTISGYGRVPGGLQAKCNHATHVCAFNPDCTPNPRAAGFNRATNNWDFFASNGAAGRHDDDGLPYSHLSSGGRCVWVCGCVSVFECVGGCGFVCTRVCACYVHTYTNTHTQV